MRIRKRSSWFSGRKYVPSNSYGFCVATTMNGAGSTSTWPSALTVPSAMASSSALCVRGVARLISSASTTLAKTGPRLNSKASRSRW